MLRIGIEIRWVNRKWSAYRELLCLRGSGDRLVALRPRKQLLDAHLQGTGKLVYVREGDVALPPLN